MAKGTAARGTEQTREEARGILREAGLRPTSCRVALLDLLLRAPGPATQRDLAANLEALGFNRVTVYRSLQAFLEAAIVHRIVTEDRVWRFAVSRCGGRGHCHPHFSCRGCGRIQCLNRIAIPEVTVQGHRVEAQAMYLWGLCPDCLQKESGESK